MSDPKREKLEAEAQELAAHMDDCHDLRCETTHARKLADWAERREREAVAERDREWREALFPNTPTVAWTPEMAGKFKQKVIDAVAAERKALLEIIYSIPLSGEIHSASSRGFRNRLLDALDEKP